jgi:hypothetical protein
MRGHSLRVFQRAAGVEISHDAGGAKRVIAHMHNQSSRHRTPLHHAPDINTVHPMIR